MTINIAWRDESTAYIIADSALTFQLGGMPGSDLSTVGEKQSSGPFRVEEAGVKLFRLSDNLIGSYAGEGPKAIDALQQLVLDHQNLPLEQCLENAAHRLADGRFELLLATTVSGAPRIYHLAPSAPERVISEIYEERKPLLTGSLPSEGHEFIRHALNELYKIDYMRERPSCLLAGMIASLQALGQRVNLMQDRAVGMFFGIRIDASGPSFQDPIVYVLFKRSQLDGSDRSMPIFARSAIHPSGLLLAWSSLSPTYKVLTELPLRMKERDIDVVMRSVIDGERGQAPLVAPHYIFIDRNIGALAQIYCPSKRPNRFFELKDGNIGLRDFFSRTMLAWPQSDPGNLPSVVPHVFLVDK